MDIPLAPFLIRGRAIIRTMITRKGAGRLWVAAVLPLLFALLAVFPGCRTGGNAAGADLLQTIRERGRLVAGVKYDSKPFGYLDTGGELKGFDIDLVRELARRILGDPESVDFQQVMSSTRVIALNSGSVDLVAATMTVTPDREAVIDFSDIYFMAHQKVLVPWESPVNALDDLSGKTILYVFGTTSEENIKKRLPQAGFTGFKTSTDAFSALKAGRGDALTTDNTILTGFINSACGFRMLSDKLSDEPYGVGFRQDPATYTLREQVNKTLAEMKADGTIARLERKWFGKAAEGIPCQ